MKKNALLMIMLLLALSVSAQRQATNDKHAARLKSELSLSDEQLAKFMELNKKFREGQLRLKSDTTLTREKMMSARKLMADGHNKDIKALLTKEQYKKWMDMKPARGRDVRSSQKRGNPMEEMKRELGLNDEQATKISTLNTRMAMEFRTLRSDSTVARQDRGAAMRDIIEQRNLEVKKVLTEEQYKRFLDYEKEKMRQRRGPGSPERRAKSGN